MNPSTFHQIRNLILLMGSAVLFALAVGFYFIFYFSPSGQYYAKNVMLSPDILTQLNFSDMNSKTGSYSRYIFDEIEFIYKEKKMRVDTEKYAQIYNLLSSDYSLKKVEEEVEAQFVQNPPARLVITIRTESDAAWQAAKKTFQEFQFLPEGDYYRVELHIQGSEQNWAYYYHPGVYRKMMALLVPQ